MKTDLTRLKNLFETAGIKLTQQRIEVFREVLAARDHPSAETIHKRLLPTLPSLALDTVYRTLATFTELGIITRLNLNGDKTLFDANSEPHHHFVCTQCKGIQDVSWPDFDSTPLPDTLKPSGEIRSRHIEFRGLCNRCKATEIQEHR